MCSYPNEEVAGYCLAGRAIVFFEIYYKTRTDASSVVCTAGATIRVRDICIKELAPTLKAYQKMADEKSKSKA
jgi:hypothetical protein